MIIRTRTTGGQETERPKRDERKALKRTEVKTGVCRNAGRMFRKATGVIISTEDGYGSNTAGEFKT